MLVSAAAPLAVTQPAAASFADPPTDLTVAEALLLVLRNRHGEHIAAEHLPAVAASVLRNQLAAERLRKHTLANGEEPHFVCSADLP